MYQKRKIITANLIIINKKNEIFLAKRSENEKHCPGDWSIPGGTLEKGENTEETLHREIKEELDVDLGEYSFFGIYDYDMIDDLFCKSNYYIGEIVGNIKLEPNELSEGKRFNIDEKILELNLAFNHIEILKDFLLHNKSKTNT